jgi:hypothetical protein
MLDAQQIASLLDLKAHPVEGGYFRETYRSSQQLPAESLPPGYAGPRSLATAIYYLLTPDTFSAMHRLPSDEVFHHYVGDAVEMLQLWPDGSGAIAVLGSDILAGMRPRIVVPKGVWQGAKLRSGGRFALLGTTVSPGFDFQDYESGHRDELGRLYPQFQALIAALTR